MIQLNLLPNVKLEYIKAQRLKRTVSVVSTIVAGAAGAIFVLLLLSVEVAQTRHMNNLNEDIKFKTTELKAIPDISKILTIQNQLGSLPALHNDKPVTSRVFTYIQQLAPQRANINSLTVNFEEQTMTITGAAVNIAAVNTFVDTLKFTTFLQEGTTTDPVPPAFNEVVLSQFGISASSADKTKPATYTISLKYKPEIFSSDKNVTLTVPNKVTTRSETEKPTAIFESSTVNQGGSQ